MKHFFLLFFLILVGCAPTTKRVSDMDYEAYTLHRDEYLIDKKLSDEELAEIINVQNGFGEKALYSGNLEEAESIFGMTLELDQHNKDAKYGLAMIKGHRLYKQGSKTSLWDALEQFGKASYFSPKRGEPHYWTGRSYEKKDERDYELIIEAYENALNKPMSQDMVADAEVRLITVKQKQKTFKNFWQ